MFRSSHFAALTAAIVSIVSSFTFATNYNESVDGDLSSAGSLTNIVLTPGVNTITGTVTVNVSPFVFDPDSFAFTVPSGMTLTTGNVVMSDISGNILGASWFLYKGSSTESSGTNLETLFPASPGSANITTAPLAADVYNFSQGQIDLPGGSNSASYTFTLNVVPEPSSLSLIAIASCGLLVRKRR